MKNGVIAHFDDMQYLLGNLLGTDRRSVFGAEYVVAVPDRCDRGGEEGV